MGIGRIFGDEEIENLFRSQKQMIMENLSQRQSYLAFGNFCAVRQDEFGIRGENRLRQKRDKTVSGEEHSLRDLPFIRSDDKFTSGEKCGTFHTIPFFIIEIAVVAFNETLQPTAQNIGTRGTERTGNGCKRESFSGISDSCFDLSRGQSFFIVHKLCSFNNLTSLSAMREVNSGASRVLR